MGRDKRAIPLTPGPSPAGGEGKFLGTEPIGTGQIRAASTRRGWVGSRFLIGRRPAELVTRPPAMTGRNTSGTWDGTRGPVSLAPFRLLIEPVLRIGIRVGGMRFAAMGFTLDSLGRRTCPKSGL